MILNYNDLDRLKPIKPTYALIGENINHTISPFLHNELFKLNNIDADYIAINISPNNLEAAFNLASKKLCGMNVTMPYKRMVLPFLNVNQSKNGCVNTVLFKNNSSYGYNTDEYGFEWSVKNLKFMRALILGYGGAATSVINVLYKRNCHIAIYGRDNIKALDTINYFKNMYPNINLHLCRSDIDIDKFEPDIIINTTPVGMYPYESSLPIEHIPNSVQSLYDTIYNPQFTGFMGLENGKKLHRKNGLEMLMLQATRAQEIWFRKPIKYMKIRDLSIEICKNRIRNFKNISLIGFMGCGKTHFAARLSKILGIKSLDTDRLIENRLNRPITDIFRIYGEDYFRDIETNVISELAKYENTIFSTGGGAVLRKVNVDLLKANSKIIFLDTPISMIEKNISRNPNRPILKNLSTHDEFIEFYAKRREIYKSICDISISGGNEKEVIKNIINKI